MDDYTTLVEHFNSVEDFLGKGLDISQHDHHRDRNPDLRKNAEKRVVFQVDTGGRQNNLTVHREDQKDQNFLALSKEV